MKVIGITGTIGAGKNVIKQFLLRRYDCYHVTLSDVIRGELERKKPGFNRKTLQDMGNELRQKYGLGILAKMAIEYLPRDKELIIIDGIRNPGEVEFLRKKFGNDFVLIAVDAPQRKRFEHLQQRGDQKDPKTWEEFVAVDERDKGKGEPEYGQQVAKCLKLADVTLINDGSIEQLEQKVADFMKNIL